MIVKHWARWKNKDVFPRKASKLPGFFSTPPNPPYCTMSYEASQADRKMHYIYAKNTKWACPWCPHPLLAVPPCVLSSKEANKAAPKLTLLLCASTEAASALQPAWRDTTWLLPHWCAKAAPRPALSSPEVSPTLPYSYTPPWAFCHGCTTQPSPSGGWAVSNLPCSVMAAPVMAALLPHPPGAAKLSAWSPPSFPATSTNSWGVFAPFPAKTRETVAHLMPWDVAASSSKGQVAALWQGARWCEPCWLLRGRAPQGRPAAISLPFFKLPPGIAHVR